MSDNYDNSNSSNDKEYTETDSDLETETETETETDSDSDSDSDLETDTNTDTNTDTDTKETTIIDAYIKYNKQFIILISGLSGTSKMRIAQRLAKEFKFNYLNTKNFIDENRYEEVEMPNGKKVKSWYNSYKWSDIIASIKEKKSNGVIVCGEHFPAEKLDNLYIDLHFHIKLSKNNIIKKRLEYIHESKTQEPNMYHDDETETMLVNKVIFPNYLEIIQKSHINRFLNANDLIDLPKDEYIENIYDKIFNEIIDHVREFLKKKNLDKYII